MPNQVIYLTNNNYDLLKKEINKSGLINNLLDDYFQKKRIPKTLSEKETELKRLLLEEEFDQRLKEINGKD